MFGGVAGQTGRQELVHPEDRHKIVVEILDMRQNLGVQRCREKSQTRMMLFGVRKVENRDMVQGLVVGKWVAAGTLVEV